MNVVSKAKSEGNSIVNFVKSHPIAALVFGVLFGAFLYPMVSNFLGNLKSKGGVWDKIIPSAIVK